MYEDMRRKEIIAGMEKEMQPDKPPREDRKSFWTKTAMGIALIFFGAWGGAYLAGETPTQHHRAVLQSILDDNMPERNLTVDHVALPLSHSTPAAWALVPMGIAPAQVDSFFTVTSEACEADTFDFTARHTGDGYIRASIDGLTVMRLRQC